VDVAGARRIQLRSSVEPLIAADGCCYLVRAGADDLVVRDADAADRALIELLAAGERTEDELLAELPLDRAGLRDKLAALDGAGVLATASASAPLDGDDAERFSRQLPYLAELGDAHELQRALRAAHVAVIGCGGLGTWTIAALATTGIGRFTIVDDDVVELSNLNRQVLFRHADVGRPKTEVVAAWLTAFDPGLRVGAVRTRVSRRGDLEGIVDGADVVVLAADWPPYTIARWVSDACVAAGVPFIASGQAPPLLKIGPLYVPGRTACFRCHERALRQDSPHYDAYVAAAQRGPSRGATLGPASGAIGTLVATEVLHLLCGRDPASLGAALILDMRSLELRRETIVPDAGCPACHAPPQRTR